MQRTSGFAASQKNKKHLQMPMFLNFSHYTYYLCYSLFFLLKTPLPTAVADPGLEARILFSWLHSSPSFSASPVLSSWNSNDSDPCEWAFITCSTQRHVAGIHIRSLNLPLSFPANLTAFDSLETLVITGANLTGSIPPDIGSVVSLKKIDLSSNNLAGDIPQAIGNLRNLEELILNSNQLTGEIPGELGNCTGLKNLALFDNKLSGTIPGELGKLSGLQILRAGGNQDITGEIPDEIFNCENLQNLGLAETKISGQIPSSLGRLKNLQVLSIYTTMLSGEIPPEIGNCTELLGLYLYENSLSGPIPGEIGNLLKLESLLLWQNNFAGSIPQQIGNCKNLIIFDVSLNFLTGIIPDSFGNLTSLEEFMLSSNNVSGSIPAVLSNATSLVQFQVDSNQISGPIPPEFGLLKNLQVFFAWDNKLDGPIPATLSGCKNLQALDLSRNSLTGVLPPTIFDLLNLTKLLLIYNDISGPIPPEIGNCKSLYRLRLAGNKIDGQIPREIGLLSNLSFLDLSTNRLTGFLLAEIGNCRELQMLNIAGNSLTGNLPSSLSSLSKLEVLDVSKNEFVGPIPGSFGELFSLNTLSLAGNFLSGQIPSSLGQCSRLQLLDLSQNRLFGGIPAQILEIEALEIALNLSWNLLTGKIPAQVVALDKLSALDLSHNRLDGDLMSLSGLVNLVSLNVSYNNFTGYLPDNKLFRQLSDKELAGNPGLCSDMHESCFSSNSTKGQMGRDGRVEWPWRLKLAIASLVIVAIGLGVLGILAVVRVRRMDREGKDSESGDTGSFSWKFIPFQTNFNFSIEQVLECLVEGNAIGKGCSGVVYRVELENGEVIAVKKLWPPTARAGYMNNDERFSPCGVRDSFSTEVRTLGSVRHKNIVKFLGCCSNRHTRLLMYDYMPNGSLGRLLHELGGVRMDWDTRYRVILGAAQGLAYLHHDCVPPIVHRDIKANNILIGPDFEPYIADFGLAKLINGGGDCARSSNAVAGSYGYIAPEYGYSMKITEKSDVYSYGVVVLEVLTGKQPIDPTIADGAHIVDWVRQRRRDWAEVLDPIIRRQPGSEIEEMMQTLGVAMLCVNPSPEDRPTMKDVAAMLEEIKHEREEVSKADMLVKGSKVGTGENKSFVRGIRGTSSRMEGLCSVGDKSSFSASSLLHSAPSVGKFGFNK